jgi:hypothetical protein
MLPSFLLWFAVCMRNLLSHSTFSVLRIPAPRPPELGLRGFGVRWLAGNGADTALAGPQRPEAKAMCALTPRPPHSKTLARGPVPVQGKMAR